MFSAAGRNEKDFVGADRRIRPIIDKEMIMNERADTLIRPYKRIMFVFTKSQGIKEYE